MKFGSLEHTELHTPTPEGFREIRPRSHMDIQEVKQRWNDYFRKEIMADRPEQLYTTSEARVKFAECSDGTWNREPGDSRFTPTDKTEAGRLAREILRENHMNGIKYKDGIPDFSSLAAEKVSIDMTADRPENYNRAYSALADQWNARARDGKTNWTQRDVYKWKQENHLSPHECSDMKTVMFVPTGVHEVAKHYGGVAECKARDHAMEGVFDD